jgi:protein-S-isoprenylcysteine O-methyltransferase Ste14
MALMMGSWRGGCGRPGTRGRLPQKCRQGVVSLTENDALPGAGARSRPRPGSPSAERDIPGVIAPPPLLYIIGLAIGFGLDAVLPSASLPRAMAWSAGGALLAAGLFLAASFFAAFRRARTPVDVRKPTSAVVTTGPYRLSRNPGYLSLALIYAGIAILASSLWAFVSLIPTLLLVEYGVIRREERYLERRFGEEYRRYKAQTRRWV